MLKSVRMKRELEILMKTPPSGISCTPKEDSVDVLEADIIGMEESPYEAGVFKVEIHIPDRYPFEPPRLRFITPVYHPNIDVAGRICLDLLRIPPTGSWKPTINLAGLLTAVRLLLTQPNPDDPLMADIAEEYRFNRPEFDRKAKEWTLNFALQLADKPASEANLRGAAAAGKDVTQTVPVGGKRILESKEEDDSNEVTKMNPSGSSSVKRARNEMP